MGAFDSPFGSMGTGSAFGPVTMPAFNNPFLSAALSRLNPMSFTPSMQMGNSSSPFPGSSQNGAIGANGQPAGPTPGYLEAQATGPHSAGNMFPSLMGKGLGALGGAAAGAALGSVVPGIGTVIGGLVGAFAPNLFKKNSSAMQDIAAAQMQGKPISDASWNLAGYGPGGTYLDPTQLLTPAPGQKNAAPLRDIANAIAGGKPITDAQWAQAGLPAGGGDYGAQMMAALAPNRAANTVPLSIANPGASPSAFASPFLGM